jgi:tetratricopeptide (TPR) repeat protein
MSSAAVAEAEKILYRANQTLEQGEVDAAIDILQELIGIYPEFGKAYCTLGTIYFYRFNDQLNAEINLKKSTNLAPDFSPAYLTYADLLIQQEKFTEAIAILNKASSLPGVKKDKINYFFGMMNELQSKFDDAISFYKKAIAVTLSDDDIVKFEKAMNRCIIKKKYV